MANSAASIPEAGSGDVSAANGADDDEDAGDEEDE